jgi:2-polyprenyl-6-hydroxyphenyl methylase/3-demethylubiquinone-9 3-methyltransferase
MATLTSWIDWLPKRYRHTPPAQWDAEYASGRWDYLHSVAELARYSVIVGYCRRHKPAASVLDVGCGAGILRQLLWPAYSHYLGLDVSEAAIRRARAVAASAPGTDFVCADAQSFQAVERFDVIVFNECLYYFREPVGVVRHYEACLNADGIFVMSNVIRRRSRAARSEVRSAYEVLDCVDVRNGAGVRWELAVLNPGFPCSSNDSPLRRSSSQAPPPP